MPFTTPEDILSTQANIFPETITTGDTPSNPAYNQRKSVITGIATAPKEFSPEGLSQHIDNTHGLLDIGEEKNINTNLAYNQKDRDKVIQEDVLKEAIINNDPVTFKDVATTYANPVPPTNTEIDTASEREAFSKFNTQAVQEDSKQAKIVEENIDQFGFAEEYQAKKELVNQELLKTQSDIDEDSNFSTFRDYVGFLLSPLRTENALSGNFPVDRTSPKIMTGSQILAERDALFSMPYEEFKTKGLPEYMENLRKNEAIIGENPVARRAALSNLLDYSVNRASFDNSISVFDHATLGVSGGQILRSLSRMIVSSGARVGSAELSASKFLRVVGEGSTADGSAVATQRSPVSALDRFTSMDDTLTDVLPSASTPDITELVGTNAPEAVMKVIERNEAVTERLNQLQRSPFLNETERDTAITRATVEMSKRINPQGLSIADSHMISTPQSTTTQVGVKIGKADGTGWATEGNAMAALERAGYDPIDMTITKGVDNQYYPVLKTMVSGNGITAPADIDKLSGGTAGSWKKYIQNTDATDIPELNGLKNQAAYNQAYLESKIYKPLLRPASELGGKSQNILAKVINTNLDLGRDLTYDEFVTEWRRFSSVVEGENKVGKFTRLGKYPTDKEITAYYSLKQASNISHSIANRTHYEDLVINGYKDFSFPNAPLLEGKMKARIAENLPAKGSTVVYNATSSQLNPVDALRASDIIKLKEEGYQLIQLHNSLQIEDSPVTHLLVKSADYTQHELSIFQLPYKSGTVGPRIYKGAYFIKQPLTHTFGDGQVYKGKDLTHFVGRTRGELQDYVGRFNTAIDAFKDYKAGKLGLKETEVILGKNTSFETVEEFEQAISDGMFTTNHMQVVRDGEQATLKGEGISGEFAIDDGLTDLTNHNYQQGKVIYSARGERLKGPYGEKSQVLDVYSSVAKAASNAIRHAAFDTYKKKAVDKWYTTAKELGVLKDPKAGGMYNIFDKDPYIPSIDKNIQSKLETMRMSIQRNLGQQTKSADVSATTIEHIGNWIEDKVPFGRSIAPKLYDMQSSNPLAALRGFTFHKTLGAFNPAQLVMQPSTLVMSISAHPTYGVQAAKALPLVRFAMANGSDAVLDYLATNPLMRAVHEMSPQEFKAYIKDLKASGIADNSTSIAVRDQGIDTAISQSKANLGVKDIAQASSIFFDEGNKINQLVAHRISYELAKAKFGAKNLSSPEARAFRAAETSKYGVSMKSTSAAFWQKGLLAWPTQFVGYTERMISAMAPAFLGGDARFSRGEKLRIFLGQSVFFGKYGIPATGIAAGIATAFGMPQEKAEKFEGGVADLIASQVFGTDVSYSSRVGVSENIRQLVSNLSQGDFSSVMGGATYTGTSKFMKDVFSIGKLVTANTLENENITTFERMEAVMSSALKVVVNNISSLSNMNKAMFLYNYGKFITNTGRVVTDEYDTGDLVGNHMAALATALSIPLREAVIANEKYRSSTELKEQEDFLTNKFSQYLLEADAALTTGDMVKYQEIEDQVHIMNMILPDNVQQKQNIESRAWGRASQDTLFKYNTDLNVELQGEPTEINNEEGQ